MSCTIEGCGKRAIYARGWCPMHYQRWKRHGDPTKLADPRPIKYCIIEGCEKQRRLRGWCKMHFERWKRHGDPHVTLRPRHEGCSIEGCGGAHKSRGWCGKHYGRWRRHGDPLGRTTREDRFWPRVDASGDCWEWTGSKTVAGYGVIGEGSKGNVKSTYVHRYVWELLVGPIREGLEIDHLCRVRHCVNPDHLEPVTHAENMRRSPATSDQAIRRAREASTA